MRRAPIRVGIVDDHRMVREGLVAMLRHHADRIAIVGEAGDMQAAVEMIARERPDVVTLDIRLPGSSGLTACRAIRDRFPEVAVVVLTVYEDEQYIVEALRAGARGYLLKRVSDAALVEALEAVQRGETVVDPALAAAYERAQAPGSKRAGNWPGGEAGLTRREGDVLACIVEGLPNAAIAERLTISEETVKSHVKAILRKLGARDRAQVVGIALRERLISAGPPAPP
ncbi:response regulator transcription factor [bacterium]|nr:MAG: response regulator transcription factor [bacterium]